MTNRTRVALVVGASRGIGKQCALTLAEKGLDLALGARTVDGTEAFETSETVKGSPSSPCRASPTTTCAGLRR